MSQRLLQPPRLDFLSARKRWQQQRRAPLGVSESARALPRSHSAELAFSALAAGGPSARTSREALRRLFEDVFLLDEKAAREYFLEEPEFAAVVEFFEYRDRQGDGWQLLVDCWRGDGSAGDALARAEAVETPYD